jgi:hypothetical protein
MAYIYIIYSELFGQDVYKVGYTDDLTRRIKDSCYTTCFYKPCTFKKIWEFVLNEESYKLNPNYEKIEKSLHDKMRRLKRIVNLKNDENHCTEMYKGKLEEIQSFINLTLKNDKNLEYYEEVSHEKINKRNELYTKLADGNYLGTDYNDDNKTLCVCCSRPIMNLYEVEKNGISYYFGKTCYKKIYEKNVKNINEEQKTKIIKTLELVEYLECKDENEFKDIKKRDEYETELSLFFKLYVVDKKKCKCNITYNLFRLKELFEKDFVVDKAIIIKWGLTEIQFNKFYELLNKMHLFHITKDKIYLKEYIKQMSYVNNFFSNYNFVNKTSKEKNTQVLEYKFLDNRKIIYSKAVLSKETYNNIFKYDRLILSGCAGSGKTSCIFGMIAQYPDKTGKYDHRLSQIAKYFMDEPKNLLILAFTGKAVSVLRDKYDEIINKYKEISENERIHFKYLVNMRCEFNTIDTCLINYKKESSPFYIVIDELSMLSLDKLYKILQKFPDSNYILMGDENQLNPVKKPNLMKELLYNCCENTITKVKYQFARLNKCHRVENIILSDLYHALSNDIKNANMDFIKEYCIKNGNKDVINFINIDELNKKFIEANPSNYSVKILSCENDYVDELNNNLDVIINNKSLNIQRTYMCIQNVYADRIKMDNILNQLNCEIIVNVNDPVKNYFKQKSNDINKYNQRILLFYNGQDLQYKHNNINISFNKEQLTTIGKFIKNAYNGEDRFRYTYSNALTIHKSQGSSYHTSFIDVRKDIDPNLLYTAITRTTHKIYFIIDCNDMEIKKSIKDKLLRFGKDSRNISIPTYENEHNCLDLCVKEFFKMKKNRNQDWVFEKYKIEFSEEETKVLMAFKI